MKNLISILLLLPLVACSSTPSKSELDAEVKRLCAIDGGIKVYETVKLPPEKYNELLDKFGRLRIPRQSEAEVTDEYYDECDKHYYRQGNPEMSRTHCRIIRRSDGKVLGELVIYGRGGGDMLGPWHDSSFLCPEPANIPNFESSIFVKGE
ncbi:MAG: hypothetical protein RBS40_15475 [Rhodocyclaceae bacterium]|nr:hypothetical protein [Rhodocyclaceae bacterium]